MRKLLSLSLLLAASVSLMAQSVPADSQWYDGWYNYVASQRSDRKILMQALTEEDGVKLEFQLFPVEGLDYDFILLESPDARAELPYPKNLTVKYFQESGKEILCLYDKDTLVNVMTKAMLPSRVNSALNMNSRMNGKYIVEPYGNTVVIKDGVGQFDGKNIYFKMETHNDMATGVLRVDSGSMVEGCWEFVPTASGFKVYKGRVDASTGFEREDGPYYLTECDPAVGRFDFASKVLLDSASLERYDKESLRLMGSEILARHGYVFEDEDLKAFFGKQPWYKPAGSNEGIELSFIERINLELIKRAESFE